MNTLIRVKTHILFFNVSNGHSLLRNFVFLAVMMVVGVCEAWGQVTVTTDTNNPVYYLIQSYVNTGFYMRPNGANVTTLNSLTDEMKWFFLDAGTGTEGSDVVQYYYICRKNGNDIQYMYFSGPNFVDKNNRIWIQLQAKSGSDDNYKFYIAANNTKGGYNIIPKGTNTSNKSSLNKQGGNAGANGIQVGSGLDDEGSCWYLIALTDYAWTLRSDCFTVSDATNRYFYKIKSQNNASYFIKPGATYVVTSNVDDDDMIWYFEEAASDDLMTYYYIRHANTGQYLRYRSSDVGQDNAIELANHTGSETGNDEARFQFAVARGTNENETVSDTKGIIFNIIPKLLINTSPNNIRSLSCDKGQGKALKTKQDRFANTTHWSFVSTEYSTVCADPTITFSSATGKATIATATTRSTIYYTTDGTEPSSSNGTQYVDPFDVTVQTTIKAIVTRAGFTDSEVTTETIYKVATPTIQNNGSNAISITTSTAGATIYYTTNGSNPTTSSTEYTGPLTENVSGVTIKAIAVKDGMINSAVGTGSVTLQCAKPVITKSGGNVTITCNFPSTGVTFYYTKNGGEPTSSSTIYSGPISVAIDDVIKAIAVASGYDDSPVATKIIHDDLSPTDGKYLITSQAEFETFLDMANEESGAGYHYVLKTNVSAGSGISQPFTGIFEAKADANGNFYKISGLSHALFNTVNGGTVKNVILDEVSISSGANVGAICGEADGNTKIYNCGVLSGSVSGSDNVGGLVGLVKAGSSVRVVNCYNYATVSGGTTMAGIVGNNLGTVGNVRIALCMMYGDMIGGTSPVYAGNHVSNASNFTEYNYWRSKANLTYTAYNDQLAIDKDEYLTRFPFYRHILNTHRELAAFFLFGTTGGSVSDISAAEVAEIGHWVLKRDVADYPIIEEWHSNTKKILDAPAGATVSVRKGEGTPITSLNVTVKIGGNTYTTYPGTGTALTLPITDMDEANHDYTWGKVVLPFANEFEENNDYTKVCTGWRITGITGGTEGTSFSNYDVSDRDCTSKDLYSTTGFVFAQGGNYIVPYNVTGIEITANFATAFYLSDESYDIGYSGDKTGSNVSGYTGRTALGGSTSSLYHGQTVYNTLASALAAMSESGSTHSQAVVLVGNYHQDDETLSTLSTSKGLTIMSIDADNNQEPDYAWYSNNTQDRPAIPPTRFDFLALIPVGMSSRVNNSTFYPNIPIWKPRGWFEMTETSLSRMDQFELNSNNFNTSASDTRNYRCIINGGYFTQMVRSRKDACTNVKYYQIGGNAYIKEFYPGSHSADACNTTLVPINVTGGEIEQCFMTGYGKGKAVGSDIYFWCAGGKIDKFLGAYMEKPIQTTSSDGNVNMTAKIDHAKIGRFFGGGTSPNAQISGNIDVTINNSTVDFYCGGPEFGDMTIGKTVTTHANNTTFGEYYGAGFGGTAITYSNDEDNNTQGLGSATKPTVTYPSSFFTNHFVAERLKHDASKGGIGCCYKFEFIFHSRGSTSVARFYTGYAKFSLATTGSVTNVLDSCTMLGDFYGAGCQGKVNGTVTSTLTDCEVKGSAFGGGYKAENNNVDVYPTTAPSMSVYTRETGIFTDFGTFPTPEIFTWKAGNVGSDDDKNELYTGMTQDEMNELGNVTGDISITIGGNSKIGTGTGGGNVYGGGNESKSLGNTTVTLQGKAEVYGNVFGGGNEAFVEGNATVNIAK